MDRLVPLTFALPLLGAAISLVAVRRIKVQRVLNIACLAGSLAVSVVLLVHVERTDSAAVAHIGAWPLDHRHHLRDGPPVGDAPRHRLHHHAPGADLRGGPADPGRGVALLPPGLPGARGRDRRRVLHRRPLPPVRGLRGPPHGQLRAAHPARRAGTGPLRHHLRHHQQRRVDPAAGGRGAGVRGHRHPQLRRPPRRPRRPRPRRADRAPAAAAHRLRAQGRGVPPLLLAARRLPHRAQPGERRVRRPADQGRRLRHDPDPDPAVPRPAPAPCCWWSPRSPC